MALSSACHCTLVSTPRNSRVGQWSVRYVYDGTVQPTAARLYQGQTTTFRTAGGGFAPVFTEVDDARALRR
jgi:hypothetical protein